MVDVGTITAFASTIGVTSGICWWVFTAFNSKTDKTTTSRMFELVDADRKDIADLSKSVAVTGKEVQHLGEAVGVVGRNVEELLRNGKGGK